MNPAPKLHDKEKRSVVFVVVMMVMRKLVVVLVMIAIKIAVTKVL